MLTTKLDKFRQLSWDDRRLLFQSALLLPVVHLALLLLGYYRLREAIEKRIRLKPTPWPVSDAESLQRARQISRIISIAAQYGFYRATCLRRSVLLWGFLRQEAIPSKVCFGVRRTAGQLEAHAWVEYQGRIVNDSSSIHERFQPLYEVFPTTTVGL